MRRTLLLGEHSAPNAPLWSSTTESMLSSRWLKDENNLQKIIYSIRALFSYVLYTNTEDIITSNQRQGSYQKEPVRTQDCLKRGKTCVTGARKNKTHFFFSLTVLKCTRLYNRHPVIPNTFSSPKVLWRQKQLQKVIISRNISPVKRKVEYSLNTLWVLHMMS